MQRAAPEPAPSGSAVTMTSAAPNLFGVDLYPDVLGRLQALAPVSRHPVTFYQRLGYAVVGVLPDVDGVGKHDILMAKRI
jgi:aminoglycoside 6'-N-acetyltransferase I